MRKLGNDRGSRWSDEFVWFINLTQRDALENFESRRSGDREHAMCAVNVSMAFVELRGVDTVHAEGFNTHAGADNVRNRVQCSDFMEMDVLG